MRDETGDPDIFAPIELEKKGARHLITVTLTRPIRMVLFEAIVLFTCVYLSIAYAIFYLYFEAYPLVFQGLYRFNSGTAGLPFLAIGVGSFLATGIFMYWDGYLMRAKKTNAPWTMVEEYRRLPLACFGGPLFVVALFWLGWTAKSDIPWIVPTLSGIPFGIAFLLVFMVSRLPLDNNTRASADSSRRYLTTSQTPTKFLQRAQWQQQVRAAAFSAPSCLLRRGQCTTPWALHGPVACWAL